MTFNSAVTLVFFIGVEGVGHHLISELLKDSPNMRTLNELGLLELVNPNPYDRLMNGRSIYPSKKFDEVVNSMIKLNQIVKDHVQKQQLHSPLHIPINANGYSKYVMLSYPQGALNENDRQTTSPNIDIFYNACKKAQVNCKHIYLYRDPYDIISSTTVKRPYNTDSREAVRTYTLMSHYIYSQLSYHSDKTLLCFGPLDVHGNKRETDWDKFGLIFGWNSAEGFRAHVNAINMKHDIAPWSESEKLKLVPEQLSMYMDAYLEIHERVTNLCYSHAK